MNNINIIGRVTKDPELRTTQNGFQILAFSIAVNESRKDANGDWSTVTHYFDCKMLGIHAEKISPYILKGVKLAINGKLQQERWEKDGQNHSRVVILADKIDFMSSNKSEKKEPVQVVEMAEEDLPF